MKKLLSIVLALSLCLTAMMGCFVVSADAANTVTVETVTIDTDAETAAVKVTFDFEETFAASMFTVNFGDLKLTGISAPEGVAVDHNATADGESDDFTVLDGSINCILDAKGDATLGAFNDVVVTFTFNTADLAAKTYDITFTGDVASAGTYDAQAGWTGNEKMLAYTAVPGAIVVEEAVVECPHTDIGYTDNGDGTHTTYCKNEACTGGYTPVTSDCVYGEDNKCVCGAVKEEEAQPEYNVTFGTTRSVRLIEPWAIRFKIRVRDLDVAGNPTIPLSEFEDYGVYVLPSYLADADATITNEYIIENGKKLGCSNGEITENDGSYYYAYYSDELYTYMMGETIYYLQYAVSNGVTLYRSEYQETSLETVLDNTNTTSQTEIALIAAMKSLYTSVVAHRGNEYTKVDKVVIPRVADTVFPELGTNTEGYYFGTTRSVRLIEPWAIRFNSRIRKADTTTAELASFDDYGIILLKESDVDSTPTIETLLTNDAGYVMSKSNGLVTAGDGANYFATIFDAQIYTYQMEESYYYVRYFVKDGVMIVGDTSVQTTSLATVLGNTKNPSATESAVIEDLTALYTAASAHRS